ncbi:hypothetical protein Emin_0794 [Elusimicrobium minutum Pei191]|uniref:Uncharacterized protein n=1 Tax=Elusimicrobium minutum (strain Pei191) TaxID=445932 RepID=B2KCV3_ELUMP|nr:hypothetical protein [Elusimicrobium minutum]ACC98349.1 hypothetical protein Emin_0794 [Elusimicrobium minutum Pei191]
MTRFTSAVLITVLFLNLPLTGFARAKNPKIVMLEIDSIKQKIQNLNKELASLQDYQEKLQKEYEENYERKINAGAEEKTARYLAITETTERSFAQVFGQTLLMPGNIQARIWYTGKFINISHPIMQEKLISAGQGLFVIITLGETLRGMLLIEKAIRTSGAAATRLKYGIKGASWMLLAATAVHQTMTFSKDFSYFNHPGVETYKKVEMLKKYPSLFASSSEDIDDTAYNLYAIFAEYPELKTYMNNYYTTVKLLNKHPFVPERVFEKLKNYPTEKLTVEKFYEILASSLTTYNFEMEYKAKKQREQQARQKPVFEQNTLSLLKSI